MDSNVNKDDEKAGQSAALHLPTLDFKEEWDSKSEAETPETTTEQALLSNDSKILQSHPSPVEFPVQKTASSDPTLETLEVSFPECMSGMVLLNTIHPANFPGHIISQISEISCDFITKSQVPASSILILGACTVHYL